MVMSPALLQVTCGPLETRAGRVFLSLQRLENAKLYLLLSDFFCWTFSSSSWGDCNAVYSPRWRLRDTTKFLQQFPSPSSAVSLAPQPSPLASSSRSSSQLESLSKSPPFRPFPLLPFSDPSHRQCPNAVRRAFLQKYLVILIREMRGKESQIARIQRGVLYYGGSECQTEWFILFPKDILVVGWDQVRKDLEFLEQETVG